MPLDKTVISFEYEGLERIKDYSLMFLFEGFTFTGSMTDKITSVPIIGWNNDWLMDVNPTRKISANKATVFQSRPSDLSFYNSEDRVFRYNNGDQIIQEIPLHLVIVPKSDVRFFFLTYKEGSLEPVFKIVRVLEKELRIETISK
jgi:hypothetical protein